MVIFLYNLYIFVWIQNDCLANTLAMVLYKEVVVYIEILLISSRSKKKSIISELSDDWAIFIICKVIYLELFCLNVFCILSTG